MKPQRGYYSLIQFCPDVSRMETINVGVVLFCPALNFLDVRTSGNNQRAEKLVGRRQLKRHALNAAKIAIERRLEVDRESFKDIDDLQRFIDTRGNWLKLTPPRPMKVFDPAADLEKLYDELVGGLSMRHKRAQVKQLFPTLHAAFEQLQSQGRAQMDLQVTVPVLSRTLRVPYAYSNGTLNLVKPHRFARPETSIEAAMRLAMEGDLLKRHGTNHCEKAHLIVVSSFDDDADSNFVNRVRGLFDEYQVKNIDKQHVPEFLSEVEQEAH